MIIGVDFDNTIVCYDGLFHKVALEQGLIHGDLPVSKGAVRDHLRGADQEKAWTEIQGYVYGARMGEANPYPGVCEFFKRCRQERQRVMIISHKTRFPYLGERYDLHASALEWLTSQGFFGPEIGLAREDVCFELGKEQKLERISRTGCTHFVDDLPEFLAEAGFPRSVQRILFDPSLTAAAGGWIRVDSWKEIGILLFGGERA